MIDKPQEVLTVYISM